MANWYPSSQNDLTIMLNKFLSQNIVKPKNVHGVIVPHAGYIYSGVVAGKAFTLIPHAEHAIIIGPSHYFSTDKIFTTNKKVWSTPLGQIKTFNIGFDTIDIEEEHSIDNQIPFLQKKDIKEILPLVVGKITSETALTVAKQLSSIDAIPIFSTDLSHFSSYQKATEKDYNTIKIIESLNMQKFSELDACGLYPLMIMMHYCKIKNYKPVLIEYKNSGDITGVKDSVVGYASFYF